MTTESVSLLGICTRSSSTSSLFEIPVAADALEKNPASVMAICMVERKREGSCSSFSTSAAFLSPSSALCVSFPGLTDTRAISAPAKNAFRAVSNTSISNCNHKLSGSESMRIKPPIIKNNIKKNISHKQSTVYSPSTWLQKNALPRKAVHLIHYANFIVLIFTPGPMVGAMVTLFK